MFFETLIPNDVRYVCLPCTNVPTLLYVLLLATAIIISTLCIVCTVLILLHSERVLGNCVKNL